MSFSERMLKTLAEKGWSQADLCKATGYKSGLISQLATDPNRDPRLTTAAAIAKALDVSLDYMAGLTDNPSGMCPEELEGLRIDAEARALLRGFELLPREGKSAIKDQVDFQLSKSGDKAAAKRPGLASTEVA